MDEEIESAINKLAARDERQRDRIADLEAEVKRLREALERGVESIEGCARAEAKGMTGCEDLWKKYLTINQSGFIAQASAALGKGEA